MLARCHLNLKERVFQNIKNLKEKANENNEKYMVNKQLPEAYVERNREVREVIHTQKDRDRGLAIRDKGKIDVQNGKVLIDGEVVQKHLLPPQPIELFVDKTEREKINRIKFATSDTTSLEGSNFVGYACKASNITEVQRAYRKIKIMHPSADHIVAAYNMKSSDGYQDDEEFAAGYKLLNYLKAHRSPNVAVFVVRYKSGGNLGITRFEMMENAIVQAMQRLK